VKATSINVLQLGVSTATSNMLANMLANTIICLPLIVFLYCFVFVLKTMSLVLGYAHAMESRRRYAIPSIDASAQRPPDVSFLFHSLGGVIRRIYQRQIVSGIGMAEHRIVLNSSNIVISQMQY